MPDVTHRTVQTNGIRMHLAELGEGPPVVLCHGWPELWHSWRHQLAPLADAGYRVLVPDQRGYGQTDRPEPIEAYDILQLTGDLVGLLDALELDQAVFVGHDWGSVVAWNLAVLAPERVRAVAGLSVPFARRSERDPITTLKERVGEHFFYILYFQEPGVADAEFDGDVEGTFRRLMRHTVNVAPSPGATPRAVPMIGSTFLETLGDPGELPAWLTSDDLDVYVSTFTTTGFTGGLNWYRNLRRNWELTERLAERKVAAPAMFLTGERDPVRLFMSDTHLAEWVPDLRVRVTVPGAGHWIQQECPDEVNAALLEFLGTLA